MSDTESKIAVPAFDSVKVRRVATVTVITCVRRNKKVTRSLTFFDALGNFFTCDICISHFRSTIYLHVALPLSFKLRNRLNLKYQNRHKPAPLGISTTGVCVEGVPLYALFKTHQHIRSFLLICATEQHRFAANT